MSDSTRRKLELAIKRIKKGRTRILAKGARLNVSAVAKESGVSDSLIYKPVYRDVLEMIRNEQGHVRRQDRERLREELRKQHLLVIGKRRELEELKQDFARLAERNQLLELENENLRSGSDKVVLNIDRYQKRKKA